MSGHDGATSCVEALVDNVPKRFGFGLEVPIDVGQAVLHVHVGHSGRLPTGRADDQIRTVAFVPIHQVGRQLADAVNQHLGARTWVVGVAAAQRVESGCVATGSHSAVSSLKRSIWKSPPAASPERA